MLPIVDARSGKVVRVGETIMYPPTYGLDGLQARSGFKLESFRGGLFSGSAVVRNYDGEREYTQRVEVPIKWWPKLIYGARFPIDAIRVAILPS